MLRILSLGAGVQSTTVALLSKHGELPTLDCAIFADTGWEPAAVYQHLQWLESVVPFPVHRVSCGRKIQEEPFRGGDRQARFVSLPMFTQGGGMLWRQCTKEFKIEPIRAKIRELCGLHKRQSAGKGLRVEQWFGISIDEAARMRDSDVRWIQHRYPLVFDRPLTRIGCLAWLREHNYPQPPRSACIGCPMHSDHEWRRLKASDPAGFNEAVKFEQTLQRSVDGVRRRERAYLHRSLIPLDQVDLSTAEDHGQLNWLNECDGMCGV